MSLDRLLQERTAALVSRELFRDPAADPRGRARATAAARGLQLLDTSTNDYLGLAQQSVSTETSGAGASRLLGGSRAAHERLEEELSSWLGVAGTLLFSSGYAANVGVLSSLAEAGDTLLSDELNHASIIDGCRLSRASTRVFPHRDLGALRALLAATSGNRWVVTESLFSMDGTSPDLAALRALCDEYGAFLIVDEAHALGVFGAEGRGLCSLAGVRADVLVGTFGKAFGAHGAFVAGGSSLRAFLWNRARSFVFSTATSPALAATVLDRLRLVRRASALRAHLEALCGTFARELERLERRLPAGRHGPIFPVLFGEPLQALAASEQLLELGILAPAIRPPTVPPGTSRLRITLTARMTESDVARLVAALASLDAAP